MVGTELKISKICLSRPAEVAFPGIVLVHFLHVISAVFFIIKLVVFVLTYITLDQYLVGFLIFAEISEMLKKNRLFSLVK